MGTLNLWLHIYWLGNASCLQSTTFHPKPETCYLFVHKWLEGDLLILNFYFLIALCLLLLLKFYLINSGKHPTFVQVFIAIAANGNSMGAWGRRVRWKPKGARWRSSFLVLFPGPLPITHCTPVPRTRYRKLSIERTANDTTSLFTSVRLRYAKKVVHIVSVHNLDGPSC